jgi:prepilin-type N-terminal cleavage/methylation domain-containing protein
MQLYAFQSRGFSLMEILVVIAIIGILVSVVMPAVNSGRDKALVAATVSDLQSMKSAMEILYNDTGYYPNGATDLCRTTLPADNEIDLSLDDAGILANGSAWGGWSGPYTGGAIDKWGNPYYLDEDYQCLAATEGCKGIDDAGTDSSVIVSCGPNGAIAGTSCDYDADNIVYRLCD